MAFETGLQNPPVRPLGIQYQTQASGRLIKEDNYIVNLADWLAGVIDPLSGLSLNISLSATRTDNQASLKDDASNNTLFDTGFNVPLDTEKTWDLIVDGVLQPESRDASAASGGTSIGPASIVEGFLPVSTDVTLGATFSSRWVLQSKKNVKFRNGNQTLVLISGTFAHPSTYPAIACIATYRAPGSVIFLKQADWNIDTFGANPARNPSGIALDFQTIQTVAFHSFNKSMATFKVGFVVGETIYYAHEFQITNLFQTLPFQNMDLPIRCEGIRTAATQYQQNYGLYNVNRGVSLTTFSDTSVPGGLLDTRIYGAVALAKGEVNEIAYPFSAGTKQNLVNVVARTPIVSIRPLELYQANKNKMIAYIKNIVFHSQNVDLPDGFILEVIYNGVLVGDAFADVDTNRSGMSFDMAATSVTGGNIIHTDSIYPNASKTIVTRDEDISSFIDGMSYTSITYFTGVATFATVTAADTITFAATPINASANVGIDVNWEEIV